MHTDEKAASGLSRQQRAVLVSKLVKARVAQRTPKVDTDPEHRHDPFVLTDVQQAYLIGRGSGVELGNVGCHSYSEVDIEACDRNRLEAALQRLIQRHEMLRCVIMQDGQQKILAEVPKYTIEELDVRGLPTDDVEQRLNSVRDGMSHQVHTPHDWPLFEFRLTKMDGGISRLHSSFDLLIADGRSLQVFFRELAEIYHEPNTQLASLDLSFRDYLHAVNRVEETPAYAKSQQYWEDRLNALPPAPELPQATNPSSIEKPHFVRRQLQLEASAWNRLKQRAQMAGLTAPGILLAAFAEILAIWSKNSSFTIDLTLFNRPPLHPRANDLIADCTSVSLLQVDCGTPHPFERRAKVYQEQLWKDLDYRHYSGVRVLRDIARTQKTGPKAIMPVVFTSLLGVADAEDKAIWAEQIGKPVFAICQTPQVSLDAIVQERNGDLFVNWDAVDELYPAGLLDGMFQAYEQLLTSLSSDESSWQRTLTESSVALLPPAQCEIRQRVNDTSSPQSDELLHTLFLKQVQSAPDQVAIKTPAAQLSYQQLYARAAAVEAELLRLKVEPNTLVAVITEKSWEQVASVLGIHFAGAAYLPIDTEWPAERQKYLVEHGQAKVVLTQSHLSDRLELPPGVRSIQVDTLPVGEPTPPTPRRRQTSGDLAYVIFTSGSTGLPKGVMIDHRGAVNTVLDINQRFGVDANDRVLAVSRLSFDLSVYDIFGLLATGGTIVMPSPQLAFNPAHWAQLVADEHVTIWNTVPALMQLLVEQTEGNKGALGESIRVVMMSGDWIPLRLPEQIRDQLPNATVMSLGGATEASIWSILYPIEEVDPTWVSIPYGQPMLNQTFHVLNESLGPCPDWVPGQLHIGGIGVAQGYWRDEEKTNSSFIVHPTSRERLYRTGDLGRYLPDGNIEFLGREDFQVKVQGHRIELGEIESHLQDHTDVQECAVVVHEDAGRQRRLIGYVVPSQAGPFDQDAVRGFLRNKLPEYMVPTTFVILERFPLTANGKVDRQALPKPSREEIRQTEEQSAPRDDLELQLTGLWEKILGVHPIGRTDNFFDLGGHSFLAVRMFAEIARLTGRQLALATLLEAPTIEQLACVLRTNGWKPNWSSLVPIQAGGSRPPFYCVHGAGGNVLMFHDLARRLGPEYPFYGIQCQGLDGSGRFIQDIPQMASFYLDEIRRLQPNGPYYLGGFCMGGLVALEMAQQLRESGDDVGLLALLETYNLSNGTPPSVLDTVKFYLQKVEFHARNFARLQSTDKWRFVKEKLKVANARKQVWLSNLSTTLRIPTRSDGQAALLAEIWDINDRASLDYKPKPYEGMTTLILPDREYSRYRVPAMRWDDLAVGGLYTHVLDTCPAGMLVEPFVQQTAATLGRCIDQSVKKPDNGHTRP